MSGLIDKPITEVKLCQSCIERGFKPVPMATREWNKDYFICEECFDALKTNLSNIAPAQIEKAIEDIKDKPITAGPLLEFVYEKLEIPPELQFDKVDKVHRNHDKIWNIHAPAVINRSLTDLELEVEELSIAMFHIKYRMEPLEDRIQKLKGEVRREKNLVNYTEAKEVYAKLPKKTSKIKDAQEEKIAKKLGMTLEQYRAMMIEQIEKAKVKREREFNIMAGNCPECGGAMPCDKHKGA